MWLTYNAEKEKIQLPVLPESFKTKNGSKNDSVNIAGLGEIVTVSYTHLTLPTIYSV